MMVMLVVMVMVVDKTSNLEKKFEIIMLNCHEQPVLL